MNLRNQLGATSELRPTAPEILELAAPAADYQTFSNNPQFRLLDYWRVLVKRVWVILGALAFMLAGSVLVSLRTTPMYRAEGQITINKENPNPLGFKDDSGEGDSGYNLTVDLATQVTVLNSPSLALQAVQQLPPGEEPKGTTSKAPDVNASTPLTGPPQLTAEQKAQLVGTLKHDLAVAVIPGTRVIQITYMSPKPRAAADTVNALISAYVAQNLRARFEGTNQAAEWLTKQLSDLQLKVEISEEKLVRYQKENGIVGTDEKQNIITSKLEDLNKQLTDAEADRIQKQAIYQLTLSGDPEAVDTVSQDTLLQSLRAKQAELKNQLAQATVQLGSAYPTVVELKNRMQQLDDTIDAELKRTTSRIHNDYVGSLAREKMLRQAFEQQKENASQLNQNAIEYTLLKRDADSNRQLYDSLTQKLKEASLSAGLNSTNVHIIDPATTPLKPSVPDIPRNLALGLVLGLAGGIALAFILEALDTTVRTPDQAEAIGDVPSLAAIPLAKCGLVGTPPKKARLLLPSEPQKSDELDALAYSRPNSEIAEAYRALRTAILLSMPGTPPKVILITSPLPAEGKTTTSINSAIVLAQEGRRVLLVDGDLRRPRISKSLGIDSGAGLSSVLAVDASPESVILPSPQLPNLFLLPAGRIPPRPSEILNSERMKHLLAQWRETFDHIIIDTSPILAVTDAVRLSAEVDAVILVIRSDLTSKAALRRSIALLAQANAKLLGIVFNGFDSRSPDHYYSYYSYTKYAKAYYDGEEAETHSA
jgi:capsular exopolysaccharide synthesis family protein